MKGTWLLIACLETAISINIAWRQWRRRRLWQAKQVPSAPFFPDPETLGSLEAVSFSHSFPLFAPSTIVIAVKRAPVSTRKYR